MTKIQDHEIEAMRQLALNARGMASILDRSKNLRQDAARVDLDHASKLRTWAQAVEELVDRVQSAGEQSNV